ncbi:MAG: IS1182 family transposase [Polyangiaceae bacterium]|jgi:transposase|nr:IS1182 family transposase [Polyangiaceae bacterium]
MSRARHADRSQVFLLPPSLDDWVAPDHPVRFVADLVASLDLSALGFRSPALEGRRPYAAELLLGVWLFGWMERVRSSRGLEKACRRDVAFLWLTGNQHPDHTTLWRFFAEHRTALKPLFRRVVQVAAEAGLIGFALHALDGTKMQAAGSTETAWHKDALTKRLATLDAWIEEEMARVEQTEAAAEPTYAMPAAMADAHARRAELSAALARLEQAGTEHLQPSEPEARVMKHRGGGTTLSYNGQAVVDDDSGFIVAAELDASASDRGQLVPMLAEVLETFGRVADMSVADTGYDDGASFADAEMRQIPVAVPLQRPADAGPYAKDKFTYDAERDGYLCPRGTFLPLETVRKPTTGKPHPLPIYRCSNRDCPVRSDCSDSPAGRTVRRSPFEPARARQAERNQGPSERRAIELRKTIIEPAFAQVKHNDGFRRFTVRGEIGARAQWLLACLALNLRTLCEAWTIGRLQLRPAMG